MCKHLGYTVPVGGVTWRQVAPPHLPTFLDALSSKPEGAAAVALVKAIQNLHQLPASGVAPPTRRKQRELLVTPRPDIEQHHPGLVITIPGPIDALQNPECPSHEEPGIRGSLWQRDSQSFLVLRHLRLEDIRPDVDLQSAGQRVLGSQLFGGPPDVAGHRFLKVRQD